MSSALWQHLDWEPATAPAASRRPPESRPSAAPTSPTEGDLSPATARARSLLSLRQWEAAETAAREALIAQPECALAHRTLGFALGRQGSWEAALAALRRAVELDPGDSLGRLATASLWIMQATPLPALEVMASLAESRSQALLAGAAEWLVGQSLIATEPPAAARRFRQASEHFRSADPSQAPAGAMAAYMGEAFALALAGEFDVASALYSHRAGDLASIEAAPAFAATLHALCGLARQVPEAAR